MCGIVGFTGNRQAAPILLDGLSKLEYRGYDSAGLAVRDGEALAQVVKAKGRLSNLIEKTDNGNALKGTCGIGHTRWATHGEPSQTNAHPHVSGNCSRSGSGTVESEVVGVHNGIIENYTELKEKLLKHGYTFYSQTDTEVVIKLVDYYYKKYNLGPIDAIAKTMVRVRGFQRSADTLRAVRQRSEVSLVSLLFSVTSETVVVLAELRVAFAADKIFYPCRRHEVAFKGAVDKHLAWIPVAFKRGNRDNPASVLLYARLPVEPFASYKLYVFVLFYPIFKYPFSDGRLEYPHNFVFVVDCLCALASGLKVFALLPFPSFGFLVFLPYSMVEFAGQPTDCGSFAGVRHSEPRARHRPKPSLRRNQYDLFTGLRRLDRGSHSRRSSAINDYVVRLVRNERRATVEHCRQSG